LAAGAAGVCASPRERYAYFVRDEPAGDAPSARLKAAWLVVAMDGVDDAPGARAANLGTAMSTGTDVNMESVRRDAAQGRI
jgi:hypothetical protein